MSKKRRWFWIFVSLAILIGAAFAVHAGFSAHGRSKQEESIRADWVYLTSVVQTGNFAQLESKGRGILVRFEDGDYVALLHHSSDDDETWYGGGDYTLGLTSKGKRIVSKYHFCGYEGLSCTCRNGQQYSSLSDFLTRMSSCGWASDE